MKSQAVVSRPSTTPTAGDGPVRVTYNWMSLFWSTLFLLNLALMPLKAYISETFPWNVPPTSPDFSFTAFDETTVVMLQSLASVHSPFARDAVAYSLQYTLELPNDGVIDHDECIGHMLAFPGAALFGPGIRQFACAYLAHNASIRAALVTSSQVQATD
ncbi:hypothetical protein As57867_002548, partial [Aphanomyces stellatus]